MSTKKLTRPTDNSLSPTIKCYENPYFCSIFHGSCLKQKTQFLQLRIYLFFFVVYELGTWSRDLNSDFILKDCLFEGVNLAEKADPDKNVSTGYGIRFDSY